MASSTLLSTIYKYSVKNPTAFKVVVFLRNNIPDIYLKMKALLKRWKKHPIPFGVIESIQSYAKQHGYQVNIAKEQKAITYEMPKLASDHPVDPRFTENREVTFPAQFTSIIPNGRVVNQGFVISPDNRILEEVSMTFDGSKPIYKKIGAEHKLFKTGIAKKPAEHINARVAVLATPSAQHNYYHWMMELLPRLQTLKMSGYDLVEDIDYYFVNSTAGSFQMETLKACGIPFNKIIDSIWHPHVSASELVVISRTGVNGFFDIHTINFLRNLFADHLQTHKSRKIYLNRRNVRHRRILNEDELETVLFEYGFESVSLDNLTVAEQAELLSSAEMVVSGHGASLTNLIFCQPGTKILELFQHNNIHPIYWGISNLLDLDYHYAKSVSHKSIKSMTIDEDNNFSDMIFDIKEVRSLLALLHSQTSYMSSKTV